MQSLMNLSKWLGYLLLIGGATIVGLLTFFIGSHVYTASDGHEYTIIDATMLLFQKISLWSAASNKLDPNQKAVLNDYGSAIILFISLIASLVSSFSVTTKLNSVAELVPYEKFDIFWIRRAYFRCWRVFRFLPAAHDFIQDRKSAAYRNLSVGKMFHYYKTADRLVIISGDYSWLFNEKWGARIRREILRRLPHDVCLLSFRNPSEVASYWKAQTRCNDLASIFASIAFVRTTNEYNGSIVKEGDAVLYIYLYKEAIRSSRHSSVCAFHAVREATTLVRIVEDDLMRLYNSGHGDRELEKEKIDILAEENLFS